MKETYLERYKRSYKVAIADFIRRIGLLGKLDIEFTPKDIEELDFSFMLLIKVRSHILEKMDTAKMPSPYQHKDLS